MKNPLKALAQKAARRILNLAIGSSRELYEYLLTRSRETEVGVDVTQETAMQLATVYACVRVISEDIAKLPLIIYKQNADRSERKPAYDHALATLLDNPNQWQTGFEFREMQSAHLELHGAFFALKTVLPPSVMRKKPELVELLPLPPYRVTVTMSPTWQILFTLTKPDGQQVPIPAAQMYYVRGLSLDGFTGCSTIGYQKETIGHAIAMRKYGSKLFRNGANLSGVLEAPMALSQSAYDRLKTSFEEKYVGIDNMNKVALLEEGVKFSSTGMKASEAQFLETKKYSRSEIAGLFRVPPHMIGDLDRATFSNIEQQSLEYVINGLLGRVRRLEQRMAMNLLDPSERSSIFLEHQMDSLLRGDFFTRMRGYQIAVFGGWMNRNEVRARENMNPGPKELNDFMAPTSMQSGKMLPKPDTETTDPSDPKETDPALEARLDLLEESIRDRQPISITTPDVKVDLTVVMPKPGDKTASVEHSDGSKSTITVTES